MITVDAEPIFWFWYHLTAVVTFTDDNNITPSIGNKDLKKKVMLSIQ